MIDLTNPEMKKGATAALALILQSRAKKLQKISDPGDSINKSKLKMPKNVEEIEDEPEDPNKESEEEKQARIERVKDELSGEKGQQTLGQIKQDVQDKKARAEEEKQKKIQAERDAVNKIKAQAKAINNGTVANINLFASDLKRAIGDQMKTHKNPEQTFRKPNASYAGTKLMAPVFTSVEKKDKPIIHVYYDCSGSVTEEGLNKALQALDGLDKYRKRGLCDFKIYYFADNVVADRDEVRGATGAFPEILKNLKATKANNAIIITDDDFDRQTNFDEIDQLTIKGCVWWLWHRSNRAKKAAAYLVGRKGSFQYTF